MTTNKKLALKEMY